MIRADGLRVEYSGAIALDGLTFEIEEPQRFAVLGRNGAGKTTLLRAMAGAVSASRGRVVWRDRKVTRPPSAMARRGMRYCPESANVFPDMSVRYNIDAALVAVPRSARRRRFTWALDNFPILEPLLDRRADKLSGGERQSLAVAAALVTRPELLLLDEPSLGLSPKMSSQIIATLRNVAREWDMTVILAEQNLALAAQLCDVGLWLETGSVQFRGTLDQLGEHLRSQHALSTSEEGSG
jgi:branched-chain amino acid transport system ATP-binding protein